MTIKSKPSNISCLSDDWYRMWPTVSICKPERVEQKWIWWAEKMEDFIISPRINFFYLRSFFWRPRFSTPEILLYFSLQHPLHTWWSPKSQSSANHGPTCLTSVILRELVFPTWYCRSCYHSRTLVLQFYGFQYRYGMNFSKTQHI